MAVGKVGRMVEGGGGLREGLQGGQRWLVGSAGGARACNSVALTMEG